MAFYTVKQGEVLQVIVSRECGPHRSVQAVLDDEKNQALFAGRDPNQLRPGDQIWLPESDAEVLTLRNASTSTRHKVVVTLPKRIFKIRICTKDGTPLASTNYELTVGELQLSGTTDSNGMLEQPIPPDTTTGTLVVGADSRELQLGALDPIHARTGVQARLNNLGYPLGKVDGIIGKKSIRAIKSFQHNQGLTVDGHVGPVTRDKLLEVHGC